GAPGDDRVEPAGAGVPTDDVRRAAGRGGRMVRARGRQVPGGARRTGRRIDADDRVERGGGRAAAEEVHVAAEPSGCGVVNGAGEAAEKASAAVRARDQ